MFRNKIRARGKAPVSQNGTLPYDNQHEFGYVCPEDIRKCKISTGEYQEPFTTTAGPPLSSFPGGTHITATVGSKAGGKMAEYYSCTLVSNPTPPNNPGKENVREQ